MRRYWRFLSIKDKLPITQKQYSNEKLKLNSSPESSHLYNPIPNVGPLKTRAYYDFTPVYLEEGGKKDAKRTHTDKG